MKFIGIDPGVSGGIAVLSESAVLSFHSMPKTEEDTYYLLLKVTNGEEDNIRVVLEEVSGYIPRRNKEGQSEGQPGSSMFNFGWNYGGLRMALVALGLVEGKQWETVHPKTWQKALGIPPRITKSESRGDWKNRLKATAARMFPSLMVTLKTADSLLLAEYCRRKHT
jgi:hypothetical protein